MLEPVNPRPNFPEMEKEILKYWKENKIFEKSVNERPKDKTYSFYDGPPYATGTPHYGHLIGGTIKDVIPRLKTMQGYRVERIWGWDTHGLPIENIVEKELDMKTKLHIKEYGIDKFNDKCREKVLSYAEEWQKIVERTGRWIDMDNAYITMDAKYMESVWWVFKSLWDKGLVYKGHKVMPYCPRCATGLSSFEVGMGGYKDKTDKAITVKFRSADNPNLFFLAWTTTPWTLPGNLALAVGKSIKYVKISHNGDEYILAKERAEHYKNEIGANVIEELSGKDLIGKKYERIFDYYNEEKRAFEVIFGDFVTTEDGTGIVHIAPAFGEDDYRVAKENNIAFYMPVNDMGEFEIDVPDYAGQSVIKTDTNQNIINNLGRKVLKVEDYVHPYPYCWRCDSPLIYKAIDSWFVDVSKIRSRMLENNKKVKWMPEFIGSGRFAKLIETAPDWNISRNRFWGVPIPVWTCKKCNKQVVFGNVAELNAATGKNIDDIHLHKIMDLEIKCDCGGDSRVTGEVLDVWFDSGSMPYASIHYPFENEDKFKRDFPADFIAEGLDQTRGWFNSLMIIGTALFGQSPYKNVIVNGTVLAEDGQKMAKRLKNYPDPSHIMEKYGADAMRFYLMSSPAVRAGDLNFSEKAVDEVVKKLLLTLWNSYSFFVIYANVANFKPGQNNTEDLLDKWIISRLNLLVKKVTEEFESLDIAAVCREIQDFAGDLSNWYIRRNRKRFAALDIDALNTLYLVLLELSKVLAPLMPFVTEEIYRNLAPVSSLFLPESVHLAGYPQCDDSKIDEELEKEMGYLRKLVEMGFSIRDDKKIKVRQPLARVTAIIGKANLDDNLIPILLDELNVKEFTKSDTDFADKVTVSLKTKPPIELSLDIKLTPELELEGLAREILRKIQVLRKEIGLSIEDKIDISFETESDILAQAVKNPTFVNGAKVESSKKSVNKETARELMINGEKIWVEIKKT